MKWFINLVRFLASGTRTGTFRIDPDHLPGLRVPKAAPRSPVAYPKPEAVAHVNVLDMYRRYKRSRVGKPFTPKRPNKRKDIDFK